MHRIANTKEYHLEVHLEVQQPNQSTSERTTIFQTNRHTLLFFIAKDLNLLYLNFDNFVQLARKRELWIGSHMHMKSCWESTHFEIIRINWSILLTFHHLYIICTRLIRTRYICTRLKCFALPIGKFLIFFVHSRNRRQKIATCNNKIDQQQMSIDFGEKMGGFRWISELMTYSQRRGRNDTKKNISKFDV